MPDQPDTPRFRFKFKNTTPKNYTVKQDRFTLTPTVPLDWTSGSGTLQTCFPLVPQGPAESLHDRSDFNWESPTIGPIETQNDNEDTLPSFESSFGAQTTHQGSSFDGTDELPCLAGIPARPSTPTEMAVLPTTPLSPSKQYNSPKRKRWNDLHKSPSRTPYKRPRIKYRTLREKMDMFFKLLGELRMTLAELIYHATRERSGHETSTGANATSQITYLTHFYQGTSGEYHIGNILQVWFNHPYGKQGKNSHELFISCTPYPELKRAVPALSAFAIQAVEKKLIKEVDNAIKPAHGLHVDIEQSEGNKRLKWENVGNRTMEVVRGVIEEHQPVLASLIQKLCARKPQPSKGESLIRERRPVEHIVTNILSIIDYSRSAHANLLPVATGLFMYGYQVPADVINYYARLALCPTYRTITRALKGLSDNSANCLKAAGQDSSKVVVTRLDNVQNYHKQRDHRVGRVDKLNIGLFAYSCVHDDIDPQIFDIQTKKRLIADADVRNFTMDTLSSLIDSDHLNAVIELQWVHVLASYIPELSKTLQDVNQLYQTSVAILPLPAKPSKIYTYASSAMTETVFTELKSALHDFLGQLGLGRADFDTQSREQPFSRVLRTFGGDGLTFQNITKLQEMCQLETNEFDSLEILQPMLEWWHTFWHDLSRVYERHWGAALSSDPSTLGHSATKINRKAPPTLSKVEFWPYSQLAYLMLDARMLDCWRLHLDLRANEDIFQYFARCAMDNSLPLLEDLQAIAHKLHRTYTSGHARILALQDHNPNRRYSAPLGSPWPQARQNNGPAEKPFTGDQVLADNTSALYELALSREAQFAMASGDPGRVWKLVVPLVINFAGSSHSKYVQYLLEMIYILEFESSPSLKEALLRMSLVNIRGLPGHFAAGDFVQEYLNRLLETVVQNKGAEYDDNFIRNTWSRTLFKMAELKTAWIDGVGLKQRSSRHSDPSVMADIRILLDEYQRQELHQHRPGRVISGECGNSQRDTWNNGWHKLDSEVLARWKLRRFQRRKQKVSPASHLNQETNTSIETAKEIESDSDEEVENDVHGPADLYGDPETQSRLGCAYIVDGQLVIGAVRTDGASEELETSCIET